jgi:hypothetical protein
MSDSVFPTALAFARHGHAVFPVNWPVERNGKLFCSCGGESRGRPCGKNAAKHPFGKLAPNGLCSATDNPALIQSWFTRQAPDANLGVVTDRLIVVDVDPRHDGDESFRVLEREHGEMPLTWRALTGGGGEHILFSCPDGVEIASFAAEQLKEPPLGRGIDIRARGGYIVAPPSRHISGRVYAWSVDHHPRDVPLAMAPDWLIDRLVANGSSRPGSTEPHPPEFWAQFMGQPVSEYRDMAVARLSGLLLRRYVDPHVVLELLLCWNSVRCNPPLSREEVVKTVNSIAGKEIQRRAAR